MKARGILCGLGVLLPVLWLDACGGPPPPSPITSLDGRACGSEPALDHAQPLTLMPIKSVTVPIDSTAPCWQGRDGLKSTYIVFELPPAAGEYLVTVESAPVGIGVLSPRLVVLDTDGKVLRQVSREAFRFHGSSLAGSIRVHPGERFLIVASDPQSVGTGETRIASSTTMSSSCSRIGCINIYAGHELTDTSVYSHSGSITVTAQPLPGN